MRDGTILQKNRLEFFMGSTASARPARIEDIYPVARRLRGFDIIKLRDSCGVDPIDAMMRMFINSKRCWTVVVGEDPVGMFGIGPIPATEVFGMIWLLGTDRLDTEAWPDVNRYAPHFIEVLQQGYKCIGNLVDCRNGRHVAWLKNLGFTCADVAVSDHTDVAFALMIKAAKNGADIRPSMAGLGLQ